MITAALLRQIMPRAGGLMAEAFAPHLEAARQRFVGDDWHHVAMWLAQIAHESGELRYVLELASGEAYEGRADLGNTEPGDGARYKGRGLLQLTGRANYRRCGEALGVDLIAEPWLLQRDDYAALSAGWVWSDFGCGALMAEPTPVIAVTRRINGGTNGLENRRAYYTVAITAMKAINGNGMQAPAAEAEPATPSRVPLLHLGQPPRPAPAPATPDKEPTMPLPAPALIALGAELLKVIPWGKKRSERIDEAAPVLVEIAKAVVPGANEQAAVQKVLSDREAQAQFVAAAAVRWADLEPILRFEAEERDKARAFAERITAGDTWQAIGAGFLIGLLALVIVIGGGTMFFLFMLSADVNSDQKSLILGALLTAFTAVIFFFFGSSRSSQIKDQTIEQQARQR